MKAFVETNKHNMCLLLSEGFCQKVHVLMKKMSVISHVYHILANIRNHLVIQARRMILWGNFYGSWKHSWVCHV